MTRRQIPEWRQAELEQEGDHEPGGELVCALAILAAAAIAIAVVIGLVRAVVWLFTS